LLLYALAAVFLTTSWIAGNVTALSVTFSVTGVLMLLLGASIHHLTVVDGGSHLVVRFGPLPLFRRRVPYDDVREVEWRRTTLLDGWGIHLSLRGGWVWNIWGFDCVVLRLKRGTLRVGTDDPDGLVAFLEERIADSSMAGAAGPNA